VVLGLRRVLAQWDLGLSTVEDLVAHHAVEALDERILLRAALLDERGLHSALGEQDMTSSSAKARATGSGNASSSNG
jgi:hypothetical protein